MVNKENIDTLIGVIRNDQTPFNMGTFYFVDDADTRRGKVDTHTDGRLSSSNLCGTPACIAGWCNHIAKDIDNFPVNKHRPIDPNVYCETTTPQRWLGIDPYDASELFIPAGLDAAADYARITKEQAIEVLEHLRDTGKVDWTKATGLNYSLDGEPNLDALARGATHEG